jgi:hypothetical protein
MVMAMAMVYLTQVTGVLITLTQDVLRKDWLHQTELHHNNNNNCSIKNSLLDFLHFFDSIFKKNSVIIYPQTLNSQMCSINCATLHSGTGKFVELLLM